MWIVRLALRRPYTFVVASLLILIFGIVTLRRTPTDIFPTINIPVVSVVWQYTGTAPIDMERRMVSVFERAATTTVNNIEHIESQSFYGVGVVRVYFHPETRIEGGVAQLTAIAQTILKVLPPGTTAPLIVQYSATNVPILQIGMSSTTLPEQDMWDLANSFMRTQLATVQGAQIPYPYGGRMRQIMVDLDPNALTAKGISPYDVVSAINVQNLLLPAGTAKIGTREYEVGLNGSPLALEQLNDLPIRQVNGAMVYVRDVAHVHDGYAVQTNVVRQNGTRGVLITILKAGRASTLDIVKQVKTVIPQIAASLPKSLRLNYVIDQSIFVRAALVGVLREGIIAAMLTALMILLFLGSWRSTLIVATSIPLAILCSIICLGSLGQTMNVMTLGGLALAVGILVDDATVEIENIHRNLGQKKELTHAILDGASQIAVPAFVSTLSICVVFVPIFFLGGIAGSLFAPLAMAVIFAMLASYLLSRTVVPTMVQFLLPAEAHLYVEGGESGHAQSGSGPLWWAFRHVNAVFEKVRDRYHALLERALDHRRLTALAAAVFCGLSLCLIPFIGEDFFPTVDAGQMRLHVRAPPGTRIEETEQFVAQVERTVRSVIAPSDLAVIVDNIGLPYSGMNLSLSDSPTMSAADAEVQISLKPDHATSTLEYIRRLRQVLHKSYAGAEFSFGAADIVSQILNFGLPAPVDVQVVGADPRNYGIARDIARRVSTIPGAADVRVQQVVHAPQLTYDVDRTRASQLGFTQQSVVNSVLTSLSSSVQTSPNFWVSPQNGVAYPLVVQTPQTQLATLDAIGATPLSPTPAGGPGTATTDLDAPSRTVPAGSAPASQLLRNLATSGRATTPAVISHFNVQPVYDVYADVQGIDLGSVAHGVDRVVHAVTPTLPRGSSIVSRGQVLSMRKSFAGLLSGLAFAIVLVYFLMVVNFQSWADPFIIIMALPGALSGILWALFATHTTFSVPSMMGAIMAIGVATANSILVVVFANDRRREGRNPVEAALDAGFTRLRPVVMTALAMIIGMLPMALGLGEGGEQNAPLGRAVIGGLVVATFFTLFFVPVVYTVIHGRAEARRGAPSGGEPRGSA
jgi:multidrug efflux pump subunit AcrB